MALRLAMLKHAEASSSPILGLRRWAHSIALPMPLDGPVSQPTTPKHLVFPEIDGRLDKNTDNVNGIGFPSFSFSGSMELMTEPKRKTTPHKRGIRNGPKALKPVPVIIRCKSCGRVKLPHFYCCSGNRGATVPRTHIDDEYANALERDPKILLTTSRDPSASLIQFVKELKFVFPNAERMNRGNQVISESIESCRTHNFTDVILVHEHRGVPDGLIISHLPFGPTAYFGLLNVVTRHDIKDKRNIGTMPEAYPHLILNNFTTKLGERTANILKHLFPVPKPDTKRIITFANQSDYISFRHHIYEKPRGPKSVELKEIGPRIELRLYQIKLGTTDQNEARIEWIIRPYMNTTKKRKFIGD